MTQLNLERFKKRLAAIPDKVKVNLQPALMKSASEMAGAMRTLAPVDEGDLKESIEVTGPGQQTPAYSQPGGSETVAENAVAITVGNRDVRYPDLVEYGTKNAPAQPFFWPVYRAYRKRATNRIKRAIRKAIKDTQ